MSTISIKNLSKRFGSTTAVDIPTLSISEGEIVGFVGNNGAGKTTLFRLVTDLLKADSGYVEINGRKVCDNDSWKASTGSYIDAGFLIEYLLPEEFFHFVGMTYGLSESTVDDRLHEFDKFMNGEIISAGKYIRNHSSGNKQKIGIISAMIVYPQLLILDEPFNFLDPSSQIEIKGLIKKLASEHHSTVLISSHNLDHITDVSSRIILLEKGLAIRDIDNREGAAISELMRYFER